MIELDGTALAQVGKVAGRTTDAGKCIFIHNSHEVCNLAQCCQGSIPGKLRCAIMEHGGLRFIKPPGEVRPASAKAGWQKAPDVSSDLLVLPLRQHYC